jgi:hypothetical protein
VVTSDELNKPCFFVGEARLAPFIKLLCILLDMLRLRNIIRIMNRIEGSWTEHGASLDPDLVIVRDEVAQYIADEVRLCKLVGIDVDVLEVGVMEEKCWNHGLLKPGVHLDHAYPGLLQSVAGENLDPGYYTAA